jgi:hypothetical protein
MTKFQKFVAWNKLHPAVFLVSLGVLVASVIAGLITGGWYCYVFALVFPLGVNFLNYNAWLREDQNAPLQ